MGLTSERLAELTRRKQELVREIDKAPDNNLLRENLMIIEGEIKQERRVVVNGPEKEAATPKEESSPGEKKIPQKEEISGKDSSSQKKKTKSDKPKKSVTNAKEKSLRDFF